jgi:hypothetical protein
LLRQADIVPDERVITYITSSGWLSSRLTVVTNVPEAERLYNDAVAIPQSETRAEVLRECNIAIEGQMAVPGATTATFHYAFESGVPKVVKIPHQEKKAAQECLLYEEIGEEAHSMELALVPVRLLELRGSTRGSLFNNEKRVNKGIIMPPYWCTLSQVPVPASCQYVKTILPRVLRALEFLHCKNWLHGDVKCSNIFLTVEGEAVLGDYGSSVKFSQLNKFTGGTPKYQVNKITFETPHKFDKAGLCLSLLEVLGAINLNPLKNSIAIVRISIEQVASADAELGNLLLLLIA